VADKKNIVIQNKGTRTYHLCPQIVTGPDGEKQIKRTLLPGGSIETLDDAEAKDLLGYSDLMDASKAAPVLADRISALEKERDALKEEVEDLKMQLGDKGKKGK
jgi:hypothetical protein